MLVLLWTAFAGLAAAQCYSDANGTSCLTPSYSKCVDPCTSQFYEDQCLSLPGCQWNASLNSGRCSSSLATTCRSKLNSTECANATGCLWDTIPCKSYQSCYADNDTFAGICNPIGKNASECAARGAPCYMNDICSESSRCDMNQNQNSCTATTGCFWFTTLRAAPSMTNVTQYESKCSECFSIPSHNIYLRARDLIGQICTSTFQPGLELSVVQAVPSATGCDGGVPMPLLVFAGNPVNCTLSSSSSSSAGTALVGLSFLAVLTAALLA